MTDWLTEERKSLIVGAFAWAFSSAIGVLGALWAVAAFVVGTVDLARWIGGVV